MTSVGESGQVVRGQGKVSSKFSIYFCLKKVVEDRLPSRSSPHMHHINYCLDG